MNEADIMNCECSRPVPQLDGTMLCCKCHQPIDPKKWDEYIQKNETVRKEREQRHPQ